MFNNAVRAVSLENRISLLRSRDPVVNANIIRKLERQLRKIRLNLLVNSF